MSKKIDNLKNNLADALELPKEIVLDLPKITMIGNIQLYIENHKGIVEYSKERIRINSKIGIIRIIGKKMIIKNIVSEEVVITGEIINIEFM
ncbi:sporulation protein YqfC [Clostridium sp. D2Q-11]|uniref:Sporulation protein YqfC n=1 Tax=Anaeromonas frigoriresistens TaxID=2683708 RepID=A0A942UPN9_9FIRM|nr:sporulation protein YqfC [Anaeromonas frigoriresistens]MBS4536898.1 sporulation protein YqfC [Anaeromonas frigoriresistens]